MQLGENVKQLLHSLKYACLYCLLSVASGRFAEFYAENSRIDRLLDIHYWGDLFAYPLFPKLLSDFLIDTLNYYFLALGALSFSFCISLPTWALRLLLFG